MQSNKCIKVWDLGLTCDAKAFIGSKFVKGILQLIVTFRFFQCSVDKDDATYGVKYYKARKEQYTLMDILYYMEDDDFDGWTEIEAPQELQCGRRHYYL